MASAFFFQADASATFGVTKVGFSFATVGVSGVYCMHERDRGVARVTIGGNVMFKHQKPDIQVLAALTAAIQATNALPKLQVQLTNFAREYQQGKMSALGVGIFSSHISHTIYMHDYQVPDAVLALLSVLNQTSMKADPGWS